PKKFDRRTFLKKTAAFSLSAALAGCAFNEMGISESNTQASESNVQGKPNIVFFLVDDLGWRDVDCYGSSPTITSCNIENNTAKFGGGMYSDGVAPAINSPILTNCTFRNNSGEGEGFYGMSDGFYGIYSSPILTDCAFITNNGCGLSTVEGSPIVTNCEFIGNSGGGVSCGDITLINCTFSGNSALYGGGVSLHEGWDSGKTSVITNCTFSNNSAGNFGGAIYAYFSYNSSSTITNCIFWGNTDKNGQDESSQITRNINRPPVINNSCIQNLTGDFGGTGNVGDNPLFLDADGVDNAVGTMDDNLRIYTGSPCIDAGDNTELPPSIVVDLDGNPRIVNTIVDMGAYEFGSYLVANAGANQYFKEIQIVTLDGSGSHFPNLADVKQFEWTQTDGPVVQLSDPCAVQPNFMPPIKAHYRFQLVTNDSSNTSAPDEVLVVVGNQIPLADAGVDFFCSLGQPATLDGSGSYDSDPGDVITYSWRQLQGPEVVLVGEDTTTPYFDCVEEGLYIFELVVNDGIDDSEPSTVEVTVYAPFQINTYTNGNQEGSAVAMDPNGNFVVVWRSLTNDGRGGGIYGQRFDSDGNSIGGEFKISTTTIGTGSSDHPSVAMHPSGSFVVAWTMISSDKDVAARLYDANGNPLTGEFIVNTSTNLNQNSASVAMNSNGSFVVVYESLFGIDHHNGVLHIMGQLYNAAGIPQGDELFISQTPSSKKPDVAMDDSGDFVVTWLRRGNSNYPPLGNHIRSRRYNADGTPKADAVQIAEDIGSYENGVAPSIAMNKDGNFVIAWATKNAFTQGRYPYEIHAQQFDDAGVPLGDPFMVNSYTDDIQCFVSVAMDTEGQFIVVWASKYQDGSDYGIYGQQFNSDGTPIDGEFRLNIYTLGRQWYPDVTMNDNGKYVAVWESEGGQDGSGDGIFGEFGQFPKLVIEAEVDIDPDTLNLASKGKFACFIQLPEEHDINEIDPNSIWLETEVGEIEALKVLLDDEQQVAIAKFSRTDAQEVIDTGDEIELIISGELMDRILFEGTDIIRVIDKGGKK
ncbi:MAG: PKD domain-containing protein, partial [Planctomycetota bacterium]